MSQVWLIEDEDELRELFQDIFSSPIVEIKTFSNSKDLFKELSVSTPNLLFLDLNIKEKTSGIDIAKMISKEIPKVLLTGHASDTLDSSCFIKILEKPYDINKIKELINNY